MCFAKAKACSPINSVLETILSRYFTSHVASVISRGIVRCAPVIIKYGEHPVPFLTVILSAHVTWCKCQNHFTSLLVALYNICLKSQCGLSTAPFTWELYGEIVTPFIPYFSSSQATAFLNGAPLSVMIFTKLLHQQIISSKSHCPIALAFSCQSAFASIHNDKPHLPWTIYLQLFDREVIWTMSACNTWNVVSANSSDRNEANCPLYQQLTKRTR